MENYIPNRSTNPIGKLARATRDRIFYCKTDKTYYSVKKCVFLSFLGGIRGFFILTRNLEKKRKFFSLVLGKIREVSLPFVVDVSDIALWRIPTG